MADDSTDDFGLDPRLADIEAVLRELDADDLVLEAPPADVWAGIEAELGSEAPAATSDASIVVPLRRRTKWVGPALAAAAVVLIAVGAIVVATRGGSEPTTLATAELTFDADAFDPAGVDAAANALLLDDDGVDVLEIDDASLPFDLDEDASLELWMIRVEDGEIVDMVSLGDIDEDGTRDFTVPDGYDPAVFSVVDISIEPDDGDATHSGRSILRGELATA